MTSLLRTTTSSTNLSSVIGFLGLLAFISFIWTRLTSSRPQLPPGPRRKPIIGNLLDFPPHGTQQERHWTRHKELYGPISSMEVFGQPIIIINDPKIGRELLEKRAINYSNRPHMTFAGELCGLTNAMILEQHNERFRNLRKVAHNQIGSLTSLQKWAKDLDIETHQYLFRLLEEPERWTHHLRQEAGSMILKITYGYTVEPCNKDLLITLGEQSVDVFSKAVIPGAWLVDMIPALKHLPEWAPGTAFKRTARQYHQIQIDATSKPFEFTRKQIAQNKAPASIVSESLRKLNSNSVATAEDVDDIMWAAASIFGGGSDTTVAAMEMFFLAMTKFPDAQRKAQAELDRVVGTSRLPQASDRAHLPYTEAVVKECLRWQPILEVTVPHTSVADDFYEGHFIPKGSMILFNTVGLFHDESVYSDPLDFKPERFLGDNPEYDANEVIWGFGRRICPGRWLAASNMWLQIARTLSCFEIKSLSGHEPAVEFTYGAVRRPLPFKADIQVRSTEHAELIRSVAVEHPFPAEGDGKLL